jgi:hypothetical protein
MRSDFRSLCAELLNVLRGISVPRERDDVFFLSSFVHQEGYVFSAVDSFGKSILKEMY